MRGGSDLRKAYRVIAALAVTVLVVAGVTVALRGVYGYFSDDMIVSGTFPRASQALKKGSDVKYLGVTVGKVKSIKLLDDHRVQIKLAIGKNRKIPSNVKAVIAPNTFFGDKFVDLQAQDGRHDQPWLGNGSHLAATSSGEEVEQLIGTANTLLSGINTDDLKTLINELARFNRGEGDKIAQNLEVGVQAANSFGQTIDAQLQALDAFARFQSSIKNLGPALNTISNDLNVALPTFNDARAQFEKALTTFRPFANDLASLISVNRPDLDRILANGDNIGQTIYGLSRYLYKFGSGASEDTLPDGTKFAYFKQIADFKDIATLLCGVIGPPEAPIEALQNQLLGLLATASGGKIDCSAYANPTTVAPAVSAPAATASPSTSLQATAPNFQDKVYGAIGTPDQSKPAPLSSFISRLLGGGS
jgi:virulence factor Mce-like protein